MTRTHSKASELNGNSKPLAKKSHVKKSLTTNTGGRLQTSAKTSQKTFVAREAQLKSKGTSLANSDLSRLPKETLRNLYQLMVKARVLEERLIKIYKAGDAYFWIGAPGEEAWGVALGLQVKKGHGPAYDFLHLHYRGTPTLVAMGMPVIDAIRLIMNRSTDPCTGGRNFSNHYCFPQWNVVPVTSPIEVQYVQAIGTAHVQKRGGSKSVTIVTGGDAGTAEGDFASCLIWASRPERELPILITVQNNLWGISTPAQGQHGETHIADRARAFNIRARVIDGTDPVESYLAVQEELEFIRRTGKPSFIECRTTRLFGHSSASGANRVQDEVDPVLNFESRLIKTGIVSLQESKDLWENFANECQQAYAQVKTEPSPQSNTVWDHYFANGENGDWRKF